MSKPPAAVASRRGRRRGVGGCGAFVAALIVAAGAVAVFTLAPVRGAGQSLRGRRDLTCDGDSIGEPKCTPSQCGRVVRDGFATDAEVALLATLARDATRLGKGAGGATVFDPVSGALSRGDKFIDAYRVCEMAAEAENEKKKAGGGGGGPAATTENCPVSAEALRTYAAVAARIRAAVSEAFPAPQLPMLTSPSFVSVLTANPARTSHDEYWHSHVDRAQYGSFEYTALLYLSDGAGADFEGGEFAFVDAGTERDLVVPRRGRLLMFTSGQENTHRVRKVRSGTRLAMTIAFTCDPERGIDIDTFLDGRIAAVSPKGGNLGKEAERGE